MSEIVVVAILIHFLINLLFGGLCVSVLRLLCVLLFTLLLLLLLRAHGVAWFSPGGCWTNTVPLTLWLMPGSMPLLQLLPESSR
jgi:hypothetical protein